jgi:predicted O-methyltransferase YrrM
MIDAAAGRNLMSSLENEPLKTLLARLHAQSEGQTEALVSYIAANGRTSISGSAADLERGRDFWRDKLVALAPDKARFCYALCRALKARRAVEAGTSFGVSTLYLAAAMRDNGGGTVVATEYEAAKAAIARSHFAEAGLSDFIELREGDLRETLKELHGPVDFMLVDIWTPLARPAIALVAPHLRQGAVVIADNTDAHRGAYGDYFAFLADPVNAFSTMTLPFDGGLEMSVKLGTTVSTMPPATS